MIDELPASASDETRGWLIVLFRKRWANSVMSSPRTENATISKTDLCLSFFVRGRSTIRMILLGKPRVRMLSAGFTVTVIAPKNSHAGGVRIRDTSYSQFR